MIFHPFHLLVIALAAWMNRQQLDVIEYLKEENRVPREQIGDKRLRFTDVQRRRLAARAQEVGHGDGPVANGSGAAAASFVKIMREGEQARGVSNRSEASRGEGFHRARGELNRIDPVAAGPPCATPPRNDADHSGAPSATSDRNE